MLTTFLKSRMDWLYKTISSHTAPVILLGVLIVIVCAVIMLEYRWVEFLQIWYYATRILLVWWALLLTLGASLALRNRSASRDTYALSFVCIWVLFALWVGSVPELWEFGELNTRWTDIAIVLALCAVMVVLVPLRAARRLYDDTGLYEWVTYAARALILWWVFWWIAVGWLLWALWWVETLFDLSIESVVYQLVWAIVWIWVWWLIAIDEMRTWSIDTPQLLLYTDQPPKRLVLFLWILWGLLWIYALILYAYLIKVSFMDSLPSNEIGWWGVAYIVSSFIYLAVSWLVTSGRRETSRYALRIVILAAMVPVACMVCSALLERVAEYWVTWARYFGVALVVWSVIVWIALMVRKTMSLQQALWTLCGVLLIAVLGWPIGWKQMSLESQTARGEYQYILNTFGEEALPKWITQDDIFNTWMRSSDSSIKSYYVSGRWDWVGIPGAWVLFDNIFWRDTNDRNSNYDIEELPAVRVTKAWWKGIRVTYQSDSYVVDLSELIQLPKGEITAQQWTIPFDWWVVYVRDLTYDEKDESIERLSMSLFLEEESGLELD